MPCSFHVLLVHGIIFVESAQHSQRTTGALAWALPNPGLQHWQGQAASPRSSRSPGCSRGTCCTHTMVPGTSERSPLGLDGQAKHGLSGKHLLKHQAAARATSPALHDLPCRGRGGRTASPPGVPRWAVTGAARHPLTLGATSC